VAIAQILVEEIVQEEIDQTLGVVTVLVVTDPILVEETARGEIVLVAETGLQRVIWVTFSISIGRSALVMEAIGPAEEIAPTSAAAIARTVLIVQASLTAIGPILVAEIAPISGMATVAMADGRGIAVIGPISTTVIVGATTTLSTIARSGPISTTARISIFATIGTTPS